MQLWDVATAKAGAKLTGHTDWVLALAFSPDGKSLASGGYDGTAKIWDVATGKKLLDVPARAAAMPNQPPPEANTVMSLAFSPDGKTLAVGGSDTLIHLLNAADGKLVRSLPGHTSAVTALAFHPGGALLVSGSKDRTVRLWNPANGQAPQDAGRTHGLGRRAGVLRAGDAAGVGRGRPDAAALGLEGPLNFTREGKPLSRPVHRPSRRPGRCPGSRGK